MTEPDNLDKLSNSAYLDFKEDALLMPAYGVDVMRLWDEVSRLDSIVESLIAKVEWLENRDD